MLPVAAHRESLRRIQEAYCERPAGWRINGIMMYDIVLYRCERINKFRFIDDLFLIVSANRLRPVFGETPSSELAPFRSQISLFRIKFR